MHLLLRLYDHQEGRIRIDGRDVRTLPRRAVRRAVAAVLQEPFLYARTVATNLRVGRHDATDEDLVACATRAAVHEAIEAFAHGYETLVGERGVTLSGGQRQRMTLARALLADAPILVLDDALSAVDTRTERRILAALRARRGRRTTLCITHRLVSVRETDRVLVLEHGRIVQSGTHDELIARPGPYRRLWEVQSSLTGEASNLEEPV